MTKQAQLDTLAVELEQMTARVAALRAGIQDLEDYLNGSKFRRPGADHVNVVDVLERLKETNSAESDIAVEPWGWVCDASAQREVKLNGYANFERTGTWFWR